MPRKKKKTVGKYELGKLLGEGTFGKVQLGTDIETGDKVAVKILSKAKLQQQNMGSQIKKEISIMKLVNHPNVCNLVEVLASSSKIFIVLELVTGGELFDKIVDAGKFSEDEARKYFFQLVSGVLYCHNQGVAHRDLKPENLLLDDSDNLKISDFGLSAMNLAGADEMEGGMKELLHTTCGTPNYVAPEVLADKGYDGYKADTWSCGVILYVFLVGYLPFDQPTMALLFKTIARADFEYPQWVVGDAKDLIGRLLTADPSKRIELKDVLDHPWMKSAGLAGGSNGSLPKTASSMKVTPSEYDLKRAVKALNMKGEDYDDANEEDVMASDSDNNTFITVFDIVANLTSLGLNRIFMSEEYKKRIKRSITYVSEKPLNEIYNLVDTKCKAIAKEKSLEFTCKNLAGKNKVELTFQGGQGIVKIVAKIQQISEKPVMYWVTFAKVRGPLLTYVDVVRALQSTGKKQEESDTPLAALDILLGAEGSTSDKKKQEL